MSQETRNKIYAAIAALIPLLVTVGLVTDQEAAQLLTLGDGLLVIVALILGFVGQVIAFIKSRTATTTVIDVPKDKVEVVVTSPGVPNVDANSNPVARNG